MPWPCCCDTDNVFFSGCAVCQEYLLGPGRVATPRNMALTLSSTYTFYMGAWDATVVGDLEELGTIGAGTHILTNLTVLSGGTDRFVCCWLGTWQQVFVNELYDLLVAPIIQGVVSSTNFLPHRWVAGVVIAYSSLASTQSFREENALCNATAIGGTGFRIGAVINMPLDITCLDLTIPLEGTYRERSLTDGPTVQQSSAILLGYNIPNTTDNIYVACSAGSATVGLP